MQCSWHSCDGCHGCQSIGKERWCDDPGPPPKDLMMMTFMAERRPTGAGAGVKHAGGVLIGSMVGGVNGRGVGDADVEIKLDAVRGSLDRM